MIDPAQICFELRLKLITVQFNFFGECFLYDSPLLVVEHFLIWLPVGAIFRFRCDIPRGNCGAFLSLAQSIY